MANELLTVNNHLPATSANISKHTYTYDAVSNRLTHANQTTATATLNFVYNKLYELTSTTGAQAHTYVYDKVGNRTTADSVAYASNVLNQYTTVGAAALTYDFNGNLTQELGVAYVYDAENRLLQVTKGGVVTKYRYDAFNRRVSKEVGAVKTLYVHDGDETIQERASTGALSADYVYGPKIDEVLTMTRGANTYYYFYDGLGSVRQITNAAGVVQETYDYDVYGKPVAASTKGNPVMFTGRWFDSESGLYYYRARYYSPTLGRFLQRDPIGYLAGMNLYAYVSNNPINKTDPLGFFEVIMDPKQNVGSIKKGNIILNDRFSNKRGGFTFNYHVVGTLQFKARRDPYGIWNSPSDFGQISISGTMNLGRLRILSFRTNYTDIDFLWNIDPNCLINLLNADFPDIIEYLLAAGDPCGGDFIVSGNLDFLLNILGGVVSGNGKLTANKFQEILQELGVLK